ncbi:hypothetical protein [Allopontixanthobacter sp.]|uniref:hypothetical protein n=1 Tax=Allopontixanthobacter sp. TaxID=2906452 RepID=UPI002AB94000|nr:hypothetical protein [Allopontixanthobacter sp.]MDZ4306726.1 hypothetical protein [Allopontixanthobacter sp.]
MAILHYVAFVVDGNQMPLFKYFPNESYARALMRKGEMRFGSLAYYRGIEDCAVRGDPMDEMLHYAPAGGIEITMVADGRKLTGNAFTTAAENMFVYYASNDISAELARDFGRFCVEIADPDVFVRRLKARANPSSRLDYGRPIWGRRRIAPSIESPLPTGLSQSG